MSIDSTPSPNEGGVKAENSIQLAYKNKFEGTVDYFGDSRNQDARGSLVQDAYGLNKPQANEVDDRFGWQQDSPISRAREEAWRPDDRSSGSSDGKPRPRLATWSYYDYVGKPTTRERSPERQPETSGWQAAHLLNQAADEAGGQSGRLVRTSKGIYLRSNFDVDVDGSPRARQIDRYGQTQTSLSYTDARGHKYINAEEVPYIVLPGGKYKQYGIKLGDYALVRDTATGKVAAAVFADVGPGHKTGEGSIYLGNQELGLGVTPNRGISERRFEYLVFPGSGGGRPRDQRDLLAKLERFKRQAGV